MDQYLIDMLPLGISITLNDDNMVLLTVESSQPSSASTTTYSITITDLYLTVRRVRLAATLKEAIETRLLKTNAQYTFTRSVVKLFHISSGATSFIWNSAIAGKLPHHVSATFISQKALNSDVTKNAARLQHFSLSEFFFCFNGTELPHDRYRLSFGDTDGKSYLREYGRMLDELNTGRYDSSNLIDHESWSQSAKFMLCADR